jgi:hypothetical protein
VGLFSAEGHLRACLTPVVNVEWANVSFCLDRPLNSLKVADAEDDHAASGMLFVPRSPDALPNGVLLAHVSAFLCRSVVLVAAEVVNFRGRIRPHHGIDGTAGLGLHFRRELVGAGKSRCRRWRRLDRRRCHSRLGGWRDGRRYCGRRLGCGRSRGRLRGSTTDAGPTLVYVGLFP